MFSTIFKSKHIIPKYEACIYSQSTQLVVSIPRLRNPYISILQSAECCGVPEYEP